jgi:hypothetical protein
MWHACCLLHVARGQDTNALIWHVLPATLGMSAAHGLDFNSVCVPRTPGEAVCPPTRCGPEHAEIHTARSEQTLIARWSHPCLHDGCGAMHHDLRLSYRTSACVRLCGVSRKSEPSSAFEQIGGLCKLVRPMADGSADEMTLNVEYNQLDSVRPASQSRRGCAVGQQGTHTSCAVWSGWPTTSDPPCVPHRRRACAAPTCNCCRALRACVDGATDPRMHACMHAALVVRRSCPACVCEP